MVQDFNGTCSYNPFNQLYYIKYLQLFNIAQKGNELDSRWARNLISKPILESESQVKYMLAKGNNINPFWRVMCDSLGTVGDVKIFRNKDYLPLGYTYHQYMTESSFQRLSPIQKELSSLTAVILPDDGVKNVPGLREFNPADTLPIFLFSADTLAARIGVLKQDSLTITRFDDNHVEGNIAAAQDELLYLSIPYDGGWSLKVDGQPREKFIVNGGMTGIFLSKGNHKVALAFELRYLAKGIYMSMFGVLLFAGLWFAEKKFRKKPNTAD
jgi:uncharacterized membrane protein YfhO